jgi:hypothetical protein
MSSPKREPIWRSGTEGDFWRYPEDPPDFSIQPPSGRALDGFVLKFQKSM